jgi:prophage DNA circulation protein
VAIFSINFTELLNKLGIDQLWEFILKKFPILSKLLDLAQKVIKHFTGVVDAGIHLFESFNKEVAAWKNFKEDFRLKSRVVNIERAITKTRDLVQGLFAAWRSIVSLLKSLSLKVETEGAAEVAEAATGVGLPIAVVNAIVIMVQVLDTIANVIDSLQTVLDEITRIREFIESADTIFLQQHNKRKLLKLDDGSTIKIRVGKLHASA